MSFIRNEEIQRDELNFEKLFVLNENHLVLQKILFYLDPKSLKNASQVNSR